ncbi:hypothetical protein [Burkholderia sp. BDU5]|uniref:hypothetical protein n=1 Tax=Burkholderia sp. BDU5 TaxID=1385590 RepID=UPI0012E3615A|nr:hypothetical protein [Burkholderia sp. BDU5]
MALALALALALASHSTSISISTSTSTSSSARPRRSNIVATRTAAAERILDRARTTRRDTASHGEKAEICDPFRMSTQYLPLSHFWRRF